MKERRNKILDVAIALAEKGGFDNVKQRDVAAQAGVALGTLYRSFRSKEAILSAALDRETHVLERRLETDPAKGSTPEARVTEVFRLFTEVLTLKPKLARAVLRAMASGVPHVAENVAAYHGRMTGLIIAAMRGVGRLGFSDALRQQPTEREETLAWLLQHVWFASLVGWSAGLHEPARVVQQMELATSLLMQATSE